MKDLVISTPRDGSIKMISFKIFPIYLCPAVTFLTTMSKLIKIILHENIYFLILTLARLGKVKKMTTSSGKAEFNNTVDMNHIMHTVRIIAEKFNPEKIILFGSYANGNPDLNSDVDLLVITESAESSWQTSVNIALALTHSFPMDILVRAPEEIERRLKQGDFFLKDIVENGKVLYERFG